MPGPFLTTAATVTCTHGGQATLSTANTKARAGAAILLESDVHTVAGCPFNVSGSPVPCVRIEWAAGAGSVKVGGTKALVQSSVGKCLNAASAPQGVAIVVPGQFRARGR
jgi:hypothetical protein